MPSRSASARIACGAAGVGRRPAGAPARPAGASTCSRVGRRAARGQRGQHVEQLARAGWGSCRARRPGPSAVITRSRSPRWPTRLGWRVIASQAAARSAQRSLPGRAGARCRTRRSAGTPGRCRGWRSSRPAAAAISATSRDAVLVHAEVARRCGAGRAPRRRPSAAGAGGAAVQSSASASTRRSELEHRGACRGGRVRPASRSTTAIAGGSVRDVAQRRSGAAPARPRAAARRSARRSARAGRGRSAGAAGGGSAPGRARTHGADRRAGGQPLEHLALVRSSTVGEQVGEPVAVARARRPPRRRRAVARSVAGRASAAPGPAARPAPARTAAPPDGPDRPGRRRAHSRTGGTRCSSLVVAPHQRRARAARSSARLDGRVGRAAARSRRA